ncbi:MAG: DUF3422 family protein [Hyphomonas sp.]
MPASWADLSDRRPTYIMDTPCLTRNYVIRFGKRFDITSSPSKKVGRVRLNELIDEVNAYIDALNTDPSTEDFITGRKIEQFERLYSEKEFGPFLSGRRRYETVFGVRRFSGVPIEVLIDLHSEYFTVQFRAYPNSAETPEDCLAHPFVRTAAELLKALSTASEDQDTWSSINAPNINAPNEKWTPTPPPADLQCALASHPLFEALCKASSSEAGYDFLEPENGQASMRNLSDDLVAEGVTRLLYDDFWYVLLKCPKHLTDRGLSPKRWFNGIRLPTVKAAPADKSWLNRSRSEDSKHADKEKGKYETQKETEACFSLSNLFKGIIIRPAEVTLKTSGSLELAFTGQLEEFMSTSRALLTGRDSRLEKPLVPDPFIEMDIPAASATIGDNLHAAQAVTKEFESGIKYINMFSHLLSRVLGYRGGLSKFEDNIAGNTVLCGVLSGLAIYGSNFGRKAAPDAGIDPDTNIDEVRYFIFFRGRSRNQLARLNRRINNAGEARTMSVLDLGQVRQAGDDLRRLDFELTRLRQADSVTPSILAALRTADAEIELKKGIQGGLRHRIGRTAYYRQRLRQRIADLRIRRLVGWQTYDEYIQRIFDPVHDTYERIGNKIVEVERTLVAADEGLETKSANSLARFGAAFALLAAFGLLSDAIGMEQIAMKVIGMSELSQEDWRTTIQFWLRFLPSLAALLYIVYYFFFRRLRRNRSRTLKSNILDGTDDES